MEEKIKKILGECIGHGYNDHAKGLTDPTAECKEYFEEQATQLSQLFKTEMLSIINAVAFNIPPDNTAMNMTRLLRSTLEERAK